MIILHIYLPVLNCNNVWLPLIDNSWLTRWCLTRGGDSLVLETGNSSGSIVGSIVVVAVVIPQ